MVTVSPQNFFPVGIGLYLSRPPIIYCYGTHPQTSELSASLNESTKALQALIWHNDFSWSGHTGVYGLSAISGDWDIIICSLKWFDIFDSSFFALMKGISTLLA